MLSSAFVNTHFYYCRTVWHNSGAVLTSRVKCIQKIALRVILKKPSRSDIKDMHRQIGLLVHLRTQKAQLHPNTSSHNMYACMVMPLSDCL